MYQILFSNDIVPVLDATGKLQAGLLTGQTTLFGDYDECLDISHVNGSHTIQGQFCSVTMAIPEFMVSLFVVVCDVVFLLC